MWGGLLSRPSSASSSQFGLTTRLRRKTDIVLTALSLVALRRGRTGVGRSPRQFGGQQGHGPLLGTHKNAYVEVKPIGGLSLKSNIGIEHSQYFNHTLGRTVNPGDVDDSVSLFSYLSVKSKAGLQPLQAGFVVRCGSALFGVGGRLGVLASTDATPCSSVRW